MLDCGGIGLREPIDSATSIFRGEGIMTMGGIVPSPPLREVAEAIRANLMSQRDSKRSPFDAELENVAFLQDDTDTPPKETFFKIAKVPKLVRVVLAGYWSARCDFVVVGYTKNFELLDSAGISLYLYHELMKMSYSEGGEPRLDKPNCSGWGSVMQALGPYWESSTGKGAIKDLAEKGTSFADLTRQMTIGDIRVFPTDHTAV